ncbi:brefeldin A-inhibited guanine nucleotide-exchange protein 3-like [Amphibalanus amphitrite]|uniref:brefeldin A-inhibited guanine nucleotide-exchange protein 3-like n=1 Tax=Amphibalanus amphitrite TaxID=1232801 RepID=UPI001C907C78|nr:brefeldin A-inhibited guanine nucleotide-exchange protein 3-like [Amphibalanus amphitrite]
MEELLAQLARDAGAERRADIRLLADQARNFTESQHGLLRDPPWELRSKCLEALGSALHSGSGKLGTLAIQGLQRMLRDDRFAAPFESDDESRWLTTQLLDSLPSLATLDDNAQVEIMRVLLSAACQSWWVASSALVVRLLTLCFQLCSRTPCPPTVATAAQAAACQAVRGFVAILDESYESEMAEGPAGGGDGLSPADVYQDIVPVCGYLCSQLQAFADKRSAGAGLQLLLSTLNALLTALPAARAHQCAPLLEQTWRHLTPALVCLLGSPTTERVGSHGPAGESQLARGSGGLTQQPSLPAAEARTIFSISVQLVRLLGAVASVRPALEALFHRMLLYPPPQHRDDALRVVKQVLQTPELLLAFCGPTLVHQEPSAKHVPVNDLSLLQITIDSIMECSSLPEPSATHTGVSCCVALLQSLEALCEGRHVSTEYAQRVNSLYARLEEADYQGPVTYGGAELAGPRGHSHTPSPADSESDDSGDTEGPETSDSDEQDAGQLSPDAEHRRRRQEEEICRLERLRGGRPTQLQHYDCSSEQERRHCRHFVQTLRALLPSLLAIRSCLEVDRAVQEFASKYCDGLYSSQSDLSRTDPHQLMIINADGVYLACYAALLLNLKLIRSGYYSGQTAALTVTESEFVEDVLGSGVLVYLSTSWLAELYQQVVHCDLLHQAGYTDRGASLISLITDLDGLGSVEPGSQLLSDYRRLERAASNVDRDPAVEAGVKLARRVLTACWDPLLELLSAPLSGPATGRRRRTQALQRQAAGAALDGLQRAARLSNATGLQVRCGSVFSFLTAASCTESDGEAESAGRSRRRPRLPLVGQAPVQLHAAHVLSMEVILSNGLDLGSHSADCWPHIFRCVLYLGALERRLFSDRGGGSAGSSSTLPPPTRHDADALRLTFGRPEEDESLCGDTYGYLASSHGPAPDTVDIAALVHESGADDRHGGVLPAPFAARAVSGLTQMADRLFNDAAHKLNLSSLLSFLRELCRASQRQLFAVPAPAPAPAFWRRRGRRAPDAAGEQCAALLLTRLGDVLLKVVGSGRPLVHLMRAWPIVGHHLMEAACHKDLAVSKKAVSCIHDAVNAILGSQLELPHYHINEALFKPLETLLCLELCDTDVQDQIVGSICEFVEVSTSEIRSGWRPLFGALCSVRSAASAGHVRAVLDVFEAFLDTHNVLVFANAAVDCIMCLLKHVRGPPELRDGEEPEQVIELGALDDDSRDLGLAALRYIARCHAILASMHGMRNCPVFHAAHRIQLNTVPLTVDPVFTDEFSTDPDVDPDPDCELDPDRVSPVTYERLAVEGGVTELQELDNASGILRVWYLLLEGLAGATATCARRHQPQTMETLFSLLRSLADQPGAEFGIYCVNHLLLPMMQGWLRSTSRRHGGWSSFATNFKQCGGMATDLVVFYLTRVPAGASERHQAGVDLMLRQLLLVMIECACQPHEVVSRLGCACIRHVALSAGAGGLCGEQRWQPVVTALHRALALTLRPLRRLMAAFRVDSENFYGDLGRVKVAARRDCTGRDSDRLRQLAHQVFLLDGQRPPVLETSENPDAEDRSYVFLLFGSDEGDESPARVPLRHLAVGLLAHQVLLQTVGAILLHGSPHLVPSLANVLSPVGSAGQSPCGGSTPGALPGFLQQLSPHQVTTLMDALEGSQRAAVAFDSRPGLKFLVQKVCGMERAANLYGQAGAGWTLRAVTALHLAVAEAGGAHLTQLRALLTDCCQRYCQIVRHADGPEVDGAAHQPVFFLLAQGDDYPGGSGGPPEPPPQPVQAGSPLAGPPKPFCFADLARTLESDPAAGDGAEPGAESEPPPESPDCSDHEEDVPTDSGVADSDDQVYSVVTDQQLSSLIGQYKRRKPARSMPLVAAAGRRNPFLAGRAAAAQGTSEPVPPEIEQQRRTSLIKDSEAQQRVWTEMVVSMLELVARQSDSTLRLLLPAVHPSVRTLTAHAAEPALRQALAEFFQRVGTAYGFADDDDE